MVMEILLEKIAGLPLLVIIDVVEIMVFCRSNCDGSGTVDTQ